MKTVLNSISEVRTWRTDIPNCFYVVSEADAKALGNIIREKTGKSGRFIISEIQENRYGWLTNESWYFIKNKRAKPTEEK
jgi:hypothetical protein